MLSSLCVDIQNMTILIPFFVIVRRTSAYRLFTIIGKLEIHTYKTAKIQEDQMHFLVVNSIFTT